MYTVSENFKAISKSNNRKLDIRIKIAETYYTSDSIVEYEIEDSIVAGESLGIGAVIASKLTLQIRTIDNINSKMKVIPEMRFMFNDSEAYTDFLKLGTFYIDEVVYKNGIYYVTAFDKLINTSKNYNSTLTYPAKMADILNEIASQLSLTVDSPVWINPYYTVNKKYEKDTITMRQMLSYIASAHSSSIQLTNDTEKITFASIGRPEVTDISANQYFKMDKTGKLKTYTKMKCYYSDKKFLEYGTGNAENTLEFYNPHVSPAMLETIHSKINGISYTPLSLDWIGFPFLNCGDKIRITDRFGTQSNTIILYNKLKFSGGLIARTEAPAQSEQRADTQYEGSLNQTVRDIAGSVIAQTLMSENGYISELTVDSLETSNKVQKYLASDKSEVKYIKIEGQEISAITAAVIGTGTETEHVKTRKGKLLYWTDETHSGTTFSTTEFPVLIYKYNEGTNFKINIENGPVITLGAGDGASEHGAQGRIYKDAGGLIVEYYKNNTGERMAIKMSNNGIEVIGNTGERGLRNITIQAEAPDSPSHNDLWIDTDMGG